jgi:hypothetical protein
VLIKDAVKAKAPEGLPLPAAIRGAPAAATAADGAEPAAESKE